MKQILSILMLVILIAGNVSASAADIAYVTKDTSNPDEKFIEAIDSLGFSYELIDDSEVSNTDFSEYGMILIGNEGISDVPVDEYPSLILDPDYYDGWSSVLGGVTGNQPLTADNVATTSSITKGVRGIIQVYTQATFDYSGLAIPMYYLTGQKYGASKITQTNSAQGNNNVNYVVATKDDPRRIFFGIVFSEYWTPETEKLFRNSIKWVLNGEEVNVAPELYEEIPTVTWSIGETAEIDLYDYFSDVNEDELIFGVHDTSDNVEITIDLDESIVTFSSIDMWAGSDWVEFSASDGEFSAISNRVTLRVLPGEYGPTVELLSPEDDVLFEGTREVTFEFSVDDETAETLSCGIYVDEVLRETKDVEEGVAESFVVGEIADGEHDWNIGCDNGLFEGFAEENLQFRISAPDAPEFNSVGTKTGYENKTLTFDVVATDQDGDDLFLTAGTLPTGASFVDNGNGEGEFFWLPSYNQSGTYSVDFVAEDSTGLTNSKTVKVVIRDAKAPPTFEDVDVCSEITSEIVVNIKEPDDGDDFEVGDTIEGEVEIDNDSDEDVDFDLEFYLYDLDDEEVVEEDSSSIDIDEGDDEKIEFSLEIPNDVDADHEFVVFVKVEGEEDEDYCNQNYVEIEIDKPDHRVVIDKIDVTPTVVSPGESVNVEIDVENVGGDDEEVRVELEISELGISVVSEEIDVDEDDKESFDLSFEIPEDAEDGPYVISIKAVYDDGDDEETETIGVESAKNFVKSGSSGTAQAKGVITLGSSSYSINVDLKETSETQKLDGKTSPGFSLNFKDVKLNDYIWLLVAAILVLAMTILIVAVSRRKRVKHLPKKMEVLELEE